MIHDGAESCTVIFLHHHVAVNPQAKANLNEKFAHILELYANDPEDQVEGTKAKGWHGLIPIARGYSGAT